MIRLKMLFLLLCVTVIAIIDFAIGVTLEVVYRLLALFVAMFIIAKHIVFGVELDRDKLRELMKKINID